MHNDYSVKQCLSRGTAYFFYTNMLCKKKPHILYVTFNALSNLFNVITGLFLLLNGESEATYHLAELVIEAVRVGHQIGIG